MIESISDKDNLKVDEALYWGIALAITQHIVAYTHHNIYVHMEVSGADAKSAILSLVFEKVRLMSSVVDVKLN